MVAALMTVAWWFGQFPYIVRRMPHPELGPTCESRLCHAFYCITPTTCIDIDFGARPYFFYYSLCINYSLCNDFLFTIITIISRLHYFLCIGK